MLFLLNSLLGAIVIVAASFVRGDRDKYPELTLALGLVVFSVLLSIPHVVTTRLHPHTVDWSLYRVDRMLNLDPLTLSRFVYSRTWLVRILTVCYYALPLVAAFFYVCERSHKLINAAAIAPLGAFILYNIFPAVGPAHAFAGFPWEPAKLLSQVQDVPRNCMPSLHFVWALILAWNVHHLLLKAAAWIFVVITALSTVGSGEHYYIDLIVAVPFCWLVQIIAEKKSWPYKSALKE